MPRHNDNRITRKPFSRLVHKNRLTEQLRVERVAGNGCIRYENKMEITFWVYRENGSRAKKKKYIYIGEREKKEKESNMY